MKNTYKIKTETVNGHTYAGEFMHNGYLYCAALVPTTKGWEWSLEKQLTAYKPINEWAKIDATFTLRRGVLTISW